MASGVTYTFSANTKIKSAEMNQNFTDIWPNLWTDYTPVIYKGDNATAWGGTSVLSRYNMVGKTVYWEWIFVTTTGSNPYQTFLLVPPVPAKGQATYNRCAGSALLQDGTNPSGWPFCVFVASAGDRIYGVWSKTYTPGGENWSSIGANPQLYGNFIYEAA